ncbi:MAG: thiosulfate oxidation carrier protein SoxY [Alphaproteobacteria bacterium]|jgi:sulfur-oxidizing protein SoxY|nr:thiosulfate oxidation carrier protein SoxY [Alphaproteobacteria bacterium]MDP6516369.1 thiosulfate oxidation carrier protein SoxY [Alphaproteobacteria bacterium]
MPTTRTKSAARSGFAVPALTRRDVLAGAGAAGLSLGIGAGARADDDLDSSGDLFRDRLQSSRQTFRVEPDRAAAERIVDNIIAGRPLRPDLVAVIAPDLAENGAAVPVTIKVDCAMTEDDYPVVVHLLALENPFPEIAKYRFTPACGAAEISGRIRMRASAPLVVVAEMSDGTVGKAERPVEVTLGACS